MKNAYDDISEMIDYGSKKEPAFSREELAKGWKMMVPKEEEQVKVPWLE